MGDTVCVEKAEEDRETWYAAWGIRRKRRERGDGHGGAGVVGGWSEEHKHMDSLRDTGTGGTDWYEVRCWLFIENTNCTQPFRRLQA